MKLEAKTRLQAATKVCGCVTAACEHDVEAELTEKQKQLDIDGDGKIDGDDLKKVRQGETVDAAVIPYETVKKFLAELYKRAGLKKLGFSLDKDQIFSVDEIDNDVFKKMTTALNKLGFVKPWKEGELAGLAMKDGTWPLIIQRLGTANYATVYISMSTRDTLDPKSQKADRAIFKAVVKEVAKLLDVKVTVGVHHYKDTGFGMEVKRPNNITKMAAIRMLKPIYGKPTSESRWHLTFKKEYAEIVLLFSRHGLREIICQVG